MSGAEQYQDPVHCVLFGERIRLPVDTRVRVSVGAYDARPQNRFGSESVLVYTVGMRFVVSHPKLATRSRVFCEHSHRLKIEVRTKRPYGGDGGGQFFWQEIRYINPILREMEDMALKGYYEGEVNFEILRVHFTTQYRRRLGTRSRRKSLRH